MKKVYYQPHQARVIGGVLFIFMGMILPLISIAACDEGEPFWKCLAFAIPTKPGADAFMWINGIFLTMVFFNARNGKVQRPFKSVHSYIELYLSFGRVR